MATKSTEEHGKIKTQELLLLPSPIPFYAPRVPLYQSLYGFHALAGMASIICFVITLVVTEPLDY